MGREALDALVTTIATRAALAAVVVAAVVILPAVLAGILDHLGRARRSAQVLRRISPPAARRIAAVVIAVATTIAGTGRAAATTTTSAPSSVRAWLDGPSTTTRIGPAAPSGTWYADPAEPTGDSGPHGTISLDDLDARTTTTTSTTVVPLPTSTTRPVIRHRPRRSTTTTRARFIPPPYAANLGTPPPAPVAPAPLTYTVVPGDCLWTIAAHRLPATATAAEVDRAWRAIYDANRAVIGSDPNLIRPGQVLELPPLPTSA
jgi:nucleoid-associated protein YgaU